jgi:hypothetical protein
LATKQKQPLKVILDANFLFVPSQFGVDVFEGLSNLLNRRFEPILLASTKKELEGLAMASSTKVAKQAMLGIKLAERCSFVDVDKNEDETYDDVIVRVASEWRVPVGTNDKDLHKRLRKVGVPVIFLRQKRRFEMDGAV